MLVLVSVTSNSLIGVFHRAIVCNVLLNNLKQEFHHKKKKSISLCWIFTSRTLLLWFTDICLKINVPVE